MDRGNGTDRCKCECVRVRVRVRVHVFDRGEPLTLGIRKKDGGKCISNEITVYGRSHFFSQYGRRVAWNGRISGQMTGGGKT